MNAKLAQQIALNAKMRPSVKVAKKDFQLLGIRCAHHLAKNINSLILRSKNVILVSNTVRNAWMNPAAKNAEQDLAFI